MSKELILHQRVRLRRMGTMRGKPMSDEATRGERLQIMLSPEELDVLDDFRFRLRMPSRAAAVRELLKRGLAVGGHATAAYGSKSADYGVIARADGNDGRAWSGRRSIRK